MRVVFEVGLEPFHLLNQYGGILLFLVIASLTLAPLAAMYVIIAVTCFFLNEIPCCEGQTEIAAIVVGALRTCAQATLYFSVSFPFLMAFISTYISYQMVEQLSNSQESETTHSPADYMPAIWLFLEQYTIVSTQHGPSRALVLWQVTGI